MAVTEQWHLMECQCGISFGIRKGGKGSCIRCGSTKSRMISEFHTSSELAAAVALANMPSEIAEEIESKILRKEVTQRTNSHSLSSTSKSLQALNDATNEDGVLKASALQAILNERHISDSTAEYLIGQAELEGIIGRISPNSWSWL